MRTLLTRRKSHVSCQSLYIKVEGGQHRRNVNATQSYVLDMKCSVFIINTEYVLWWEKTVSPQNVYVTYPVGMCKLNW